MDTTSAVTASSASVYATSSSTTVRKTTSSETSPANNVATDTFTPSSEAAATAADGASSTKKGSWAGFDMAAFQNEMRDKLLSQIRDSQKSLKDAGVQFYGGEGTLYDLSKADTKSYTDEQMGVGKDWGAEATSDRLVQFALAFKGAGSAKGLSDEEFVGKIRDAIKEGFKLAKGDMGELPGPTGKLFNDTYQATMDKLDKALEDMKKGSGSTEAAASGTATTATTTTKTSGASSSFSVLA